jgi:long-chain acyl-CoA synthetase
MIDLKEDRADLLLRAAAHLRRPAHHGDDPHGRRQRRIKRGMFHYFMDVAKRVGPALMDGKPVGLLDRLLYALGRPAGLRPAAQQPGLFARARGLHRRRGHRPRPVHLLPLHRHQPQAAVRLHRDRGVRLPAAGQPGARRHGGRAHPGVEIKVADNGEILVRSPGLLKEYYKNPTATAEVLTADGWYHTSDAGFLDARAT